MGLRSAAAVPVAAAEGFGLGRPLSMRCSACAQGWMRRSSVVLSAFRYACSKPFPGPQGCPWERENRGGAAVICVTQNGWGLPLWFCIAEHPSCLQPLAC